MKRILYIDAIKASGLKIGYIAEKIGVHRGMLSRWLHNSEGSKLNNEHIQKLEKLLRI